MAVDMADVADDVADVAAGSVGAGGEVSFDVELLMT